MATSNAATTYLEHRILNFIFNNNAQVSSANFGSGNSNGLGSNIYVGLATAVSNFDDSTNKLTIIVPSTGFTTGETITGSNTSHSSAISSISSDTTTSWLSKNAINALLYGSLVEAYIFMKGEPDMMAQYNQRFQEALIGLKMLGEAKETTQEYRVGKVIRPKQ